MSSVSTRVATDNKRGVAGVIYPLGCELDQGKTLMHLAARNSGQNVVEYGLLIASIVIVVLIGVTAFGNLIQPWFMALAQRITTVT